MEINKSEETGKMYPQFCKWCGSKCKIVSAQDDWEGREKNKCLKCHAINNYTKVYK
jgi:hypothetical protein